MEGWLPVFKTGTHTDSNGDTRAWTGEDLAALAASYDPEKHEAPVVIGHPQDNAPAWGWVEALKAEGGVLYAKLKGLVPEFVEAVKRGLYKKRSLSLYPDMTLRHIGFLGAVAPAVKGLPDVKFNDKGAAAFVIEFNEDEQKKEEKKMGILQKLKELLKAEGVDVSDVSAAFSEAEAQRRVDDALKKKDAEFAEKLKSLEEPLRKKEKEIKNREDGLKARETAAAGKGIASFCDKLLKEGRLTPAMLKRGMGLICFMESLSALPPQEFSDGDEAKKESPREFRETFLAGLPSTVDYSERAGNDTDAGGSGMKEKLVQDFMEKNKASYRDAVLSISKEHPALFKR